MSTHSICFLLINKEHLYPLSPLSWSIDGMIFFFFRYALYDLLIAMLPYLNSDKIRQIYDIATDHIQVNI